MAAHSTIHTHTGHGNREFTNQSVICRGVVLEHPLSAPFSGSYADPALPLTPRRTRMQYLSHTTQCQAASPASDVILRDTTEIPVYSSSCRAYTKTHYAVQTAYDTLQTKHCTLHIYQHNTHATVTRTHTSHTPTPTHVTLQ